MIRNTKIYQERRKTVKKTNLLENITSRRYFYISQICLSKQKPMKLSPKYLLSIYYILGIVLDLGDAVVNSIDEFK